MKEETRRVSPAKINYAIKNNDIILGENKKYILKIKDLDVEKRPREKMIKEGPSILSGEELLAVVLNTGTKKEEVFSMVSRVFKQYGEKNISNQTNVQLLSDEMEIPITKACQIVACFELGKRFFKTKPNGRINIRSAKDAFEYLHDMRNLPKEQFRGLYLNSRYQLIHDEVISIGSLTANIVHPREVFSPALSYNAVAIIVAHNHPSGSTKPSVEDIKVTEQLNESAKILGIDLLDHVIIAGNNFSSINLT